MRGNNTSGRFSLRFEIGSIHEGIQEDLEGPIDQKVRWWLFDPENTVSDDIYDVAGRPNPVLQPGVAGFGKAYLPALTIPVVAAVIGQGESFMNPRGYYSSDALRLTINGQVAYRHLPTMLTDPNRHLLDRLEWRGEFFTPSKVEPKGPIDDMFATVTVDALQINTEELVNDPQHADPKRSDGVWHQNWRIIG